MSIFRRHASWSNIRCLTVAGVSLSTMIVALSAGAISARADGWQPVIEKGSDGKTGDVTFNFRTLATPGGPGKSISRTNTDTLIMNKAGSAVELGSIGGSGGGGDWGVLRDNIGGARGGDAGAIYFAHRGVIQGGVNLAAPGQLIYLHSEGGAGGRGLAQLKIIGDGITNESGFGAGGMGSAVTADIFGPVAAKGDFTRAIYALSKGGDAGKRRGGTSDGGTDKTRMQIEAGGVGGEVKITINGSSTVSTQGNNAAAIIGASEGGAGANGLANLRTYYASNGGDGNRVDFTNYGLVATTGLNSYGILLRSVGGNGGKGGGGAFTSSAPGASGGNGGEVRGYNFGAVRTRGDYGHAIVASSVGGVGGDGASAAFWSGGGGGAAGTARLVEVTNTGTIETFGRGAAGIVALSIGGGSALDAFYATAPSTNHSGGGAGGKAGLFPFSEGGKGGSGGAGGTVRVTHEGSIRTYGQSAYGVLLQSIGGGGGTGGDATGAGAFLAVALGGTGGGGGAGGTVIFKGNGGSIATVGQNSTAVLAQSIGGGGGAGGFATAASVGYGVSASSSTGGKGGKGGNGGQTQIDNRSRITTEGASAMGIQALSIGGGGGTGGGASSYAVTLPAVTPSGQPLPSITVSNAIGGSGGDGGWGDAVFVNNRADIETFGSGAIGIQAQSIGGGGGNAGNAMAYGLAIAAPGATAFNVTNAIGGSGGGGGGANLVEVRNYSNIRTSGDGAIGIQAQSIGGGGGNAGAASSTADALSLYRTVALTQSIGGRNSKGGGKGGRIWITNSGLVETRGTGATGILMQSIGGGGGNGGAVNASAASGLSFDKTLNSLVQKLPLADAATVVNAIGGSGGNGGNGSIVEAEIYASGIVRTYGAQADGVLAQSIGGGGGNGGGGTAVAEGKLSLSLSVGGSGGGGGSGNLVAVSNAGTIETHGDASYGIFAQSIGGGGGNGGNLTAATDETPDNVGQLWAALKEAVGVDAYQKWAADKNNAETKEALDQFIKDVQNSDVYKDLAKQFKDSDFYKQMSSFGTKFTDYLDKQEKNSVKLPDVSLKASIGGSGGSGNTGGEVKINNRGTISTRGDISHGIFAQSVGGGGGQGGVAYTSGTNKTNIGLMQGGSGGWGNTGGYVGINNSGLIRTTGDSSFGIFAQSVGGGGGLGVGALSNDNKNRVINATVGGSGGSGGTGGQVYVYHEGTIVTKGAEAHAVVAQSIGGGGGTFLMNPDEGVSASKDDGDKSADASGKQEALSSDTIAALLKAVGIQSVPPASRNSSDDEISKETGSFTLGGSGGAAGNGGEVKLEYSGTVETSGKAAFGLIAQSVGGGGGISNAAGSPGSVYYSASYGGSGGAAGEGGTVRVIFGENAAIRTTGDHSIAVFAQSIGGGGGYGGASVLQGLALPILGGPGGTSGSGGYIDIGGGSVTIRTTGAKAHGIFAQSLGGGGGTVSNALDSKDNTVSKLEQAATVLDKLAARFGDGSKALESLDKMPADIQNPADIESIVRIFVTDADAPLRGVADKIRDTVNKRSLSIGTGRDIWIHTKGDIEATGAGSYGIFAQSGFQQADGLLDTNRPGGNITVDFKGNLKGGSGDGAAIVVDGGNANTIVIGAGSHVSALSNKAVIATFGQDRLQNYGTLVGDIDLSYRGTREKNEFRNESGATYISAGTGTLNISNGDGWFYNAGTFDVGGVGKIATATVKTVDSHLAGTLLVDVNSVAPAGSQNADLLKTAKLTVDGVSIKPHAVEGLLPGTYTVVSASSMSTKSAATSGASTASPISWSVKPDNNSLTISPSAAFAEKAPGELTETERSLLGSLQQAWNTNNVGMAGLFAEMANIDSAQAYSQAINSLSLSEDQGQTAVGQTLDARKSFNAALSCPVFEGSGTAMHEVQCTWLRITGTRTTLDDGRGDNGYSQKTLSYRMGAQWEVKPDWFLGVTAAYNSNTMETTDNLTSISGKGGDVSIALKHQIGPWLLAGALHAGYGTYDSNNLFVVGQDTWLAENDTEVWTAGLRMRAAYELNFANWYVRPYADLDIIHTYMPGYMLSGDDATFRVGTMRNWSVAFEPAVEVGTRIDLGEYGWVRPYATVGGAFFSNSRLRSNVSFSEQGGPQLDFTSTSSLPDKLFNVGAGVQLFSQDKYELRAEYKANIAKDYLSQELSARLAVRF